MLEGEAAREALQQAGRSTTSRRDLSRSPAFRTVSPELGRLDETAFEQALADDPDAVLALLADMAGATDEGLRRLARRLAGRVAVRLGGAGPVRERGTGRLRRVPLAPGGDLDVDASLDALLHAEASGALPAAEDLRATEWGRASVALCLLVDRSGSVGGERLASAALAAAAVALRAPDDHSVLAFSDQVVVLRGQAEPRPVEEVVGALLQLRGHGTTDLHLALETAGRQLARSSAARKVVVLLSDGRPTTGPDPLPAARALDELLVVAPGDDAEQARALAVAAGARFEELRGPSDVPRALRVLAGP